MTWHMESSPQQFFTKLLASFLVIGGVFFVGIVVGKNNPTASFSHQAQADTSLPQEKDLQIFFDVWQKLEEKYPFPETPSKEERILAATEGLARSYGDPYTVFFPPEETESFSEDISGEFSGVGMEVGVRDEIITVITPLKGSPAEKAGMLPGHKILEIDGKSSLDMTIDEAVKHIRGDRGTSVELKIYREGEEESRTISIVRDVIQIPTLETEFLQEEDVFVISLFNFSQNSPELFRDALIEFQGTGSQKLILDVRGNPGGILGASVDIVSWFLPQGKVIVREKIGSDGEEMVYRSKGYNAFGKEIEIIVLVNAGSASASEILAGALSQNGVATLVGTTTFGKGSVQEFISLQNKSSMKVTIAKWLTPDNTSISENGIVPDYEVEFTREDYEAGRDPQKEKAIELLKN